MRNRCAFWGLDLIRLIQKLRDAEITNALTRKIIVRDLATLRIRNYSITLLQYTSILVCWHFKDSISKGVGFIDKFFANRDILKVWKETRKGAT